MQSSAIKSMAWMSLGAALWYAGSHVSGTMLHKPQGALPPARPQSHELTSTAWPKVERLSDDTVVVPAELASKFGLQVSATSAETNPIKLPSFHGVLALDNDCLSHVHARFGGEVVEMGNSKPEGEAPRPIRVGDRVQKGQVLAVIWSTDLGAKKIEYMTSLAKLRSELDLRDRLKKLSEEGGTSGRSYRDAEKDVQTRLAEVANAELTLRTWRLRDEDIAKIREDADRLSDSQIPASNLKDWARVEVVSPIAGVVLEKNIAVGGLVDTSDELFKVGDTSHLSVWAHVYEEDLPLLESLRHPIPWTVSVPSRTGADFAGSLDRISAVIDQMQHTALVVGRVENTTGDLKVGQFVTVSIELPPSSDELELPVAAVVEDGHQSVVFVEHEAEPYSFTRRAVKVIRRYRDRIYVKSEVDGVHPGQRIMNSGALMVKNAMEQLPVPTSPENHPGALSAAEPTIDVVTTL